MAEKLRPQVVAGVRWRPQVALALAAVLLAACASRPPLAREGEYTVSTEATVIERIDQSQWLIEATGVFRSSLSPRFRARAEVTRIGTEEAIRDARKVAVWYVLFGGTDPFLDTPDEREAFHRVHESFFADRTLAIYIADEEQQFVSNVLIDDGTGRRISKRFRVNTERIHRDLEEQGVTVARRELRQQLGLPEIMVVAQTQPGDDLFARLREPDIRHGATVVESFLTSRRYQVRVPEQSAMVADLATETFRVTGGGTTDQAYQLALSIGADVYITLDGQFEDAANNTQRYAQQIRAFEATTGRLLGAETGFSRGRQDEAQVSVEEATNQAIDAVLSRIDGYWEDDLSQGVQYKLVLSITDQFNPREVERIQIAFLEAVERMTRRTNYRENVVTAATLDYTLWVDLQEFRATSSLFRQVRDDFESKLGFLLNAGAELRQVTANRKLLLMRFSRR